jgi:hypothetical protein
MHAYIIVSLMAGVRPEEARAIEWEEDVDLDGNPSSVAVLRGSGRRRHEDPRSRRALKLAQMAVGRSGSGRWTRRLSGMLPDRIGRTPQGIHHGHRYTSPMP